jgi:purine-binding chemotaxis protein CheW
MDLAKIRQKARQEQENRALEETPPLTKEISDSSPVREVDPWLLRADENILLQEVPPLSGHKPPSADQHEVHSTSPVSRPHLRDPLEVILAGRETAGCDEDLKLEAGVQSGVIENDYLEYLCFRVSDEIYGINIMDIKEIIKPREVTEVPRAPSFVSGIISLRGIIIPIIDMLDRLGLSRETVTGRERVIVVRHGESFSGLLVDEIIQVVRIKKDCFEAAPAVLEGIDRDFVSGIGRADGRMIILLNLENVADIHLY